MFVVHRCDNRKCLYSAHLFLGTARDNSLDMVAKGRMSKTSGKWKLTRQQVELIRIIYNPNMNSYYSLSKQFKVAQSTIGLIINKKPRLVAKNLCSLQSVIIQW